MAIFADLDDEGFARLVHTIRVAGTDTGRVEVKSARLELSRDIGRTISAFANASGGLIICGLDERSGFKPVDGFEAGRIQDALAHYCSEKMTPEVHALIEVRAFEGASVVTAYIPELQPFDKPCYVTASGRYGGSFIRVGDGDRRMSTYEVDRCMEEHRQPRYDARPVPDATLDDLDAMLVRRLLERERQVHARNFALLDDVQALKKLHVLVEHNGKVCPTVAGLVALGTYPQEFFPRLSVAFTCYPGVTKAQTDHEGRRFLDSVTCVGSIPAMLQDALAAVTRNMRTGARVVDGFRRDVPDYPLVAVREAVANALMHRDYSEAALGTPVAVDLYADRLEITNLGGLYGCMTPQMLGRSAVVSARNQLLSGILENTPLGEAGYVAENRGSGYQTIELALEQARMPAPEPHSEPAFFRLVMRRRDAMEPVRLQRGGGTNVPAVAEGALRVAGRSVEKARYTMDLGDFILDVVEMRGSASMAELVKESGRSRPTVLKAVRSLIDQGLLRPTGAKNSPQRRYERA